MRFQTSCYFMFCRTSLIQQIGGQTKIYFFFRKKVRKCIISFSNYKPFCIESQISPDLHTSPSSLLKNFATFFLVLLFYFGHSFSQIIFFLLFCVQILFYFANFYRGFRKRVTQPFCLLSFLSKVQTGNFAEKNFSHNFSSSFYFISPFFLNLKLIMGIWFFCATSFCLFIFIYSKHKPFCYFFTFTMLPWFILSDSRKSDFTTTAQHTLTHHYTMFTTTHDELRRRHTNHTHLTLNDSRTTQLTTAHQDSRNSRHDSQRLTTLLTHDSPNTISFDYDVHDDS